MDILNRCHLGCVLDVLPQLAAQGLRAQTCVTSPPYWGLRDYGIPPSKWPEIEFVPMAGLPPVMVPAWEGCLGLEPDPLMFTAHLVHVFRLVWDVLADDGALWLNLGDNYLGTGGLTPQMGEQFKGRLRGHDTICRSLRRIPNGLKAKDLAMQPARVALALQADGWYLRSDIIWHKPTPMPESVRDRPTKAHEYLFLLAKSERYYYDAEAIKEPVTGDAHARGAGVNPKAASANPSEERAPARGVKVPSGWDTGPGGHRELTGRYRPRQNESFSASVKDLVDTRNKRSVWTVPSSPFPDAHFATFPPRLIEPAILAGSRPGDVVLDIFGGSGTTAMVAERFGREWVTVEIKPEYRDMHEKRAMGHVGLPLV